MPLERLDCQVWALVGIALASPLLLRALKVKKLWATLLLSAALCLGFYLSAVQPLLEHTTSARVYAKLGVRRSFLSNELKNLKRALLSRHHPDRAESESERAALLEASKEVSQLLDMVSDPLRREALDRFNWTFKAESMDKE